MHMADALVSPAVAGTMYAASAAAAAYSVKRVKIDDLDKKIPVMGVMGAFVFAAQMINFTIPGTGSSGHLCGGMLLSAVLGPHAGFLTMIAVLAIQCLISDLEGNDGAEDDQGKDHGGVRDRMHGRAAVRSIFSDGRDIAVRDHGASVCGILRDDAADPSGDRAGGRADHSGGISVCL